MLFMTLWLIAWITLAAAGVISWWFVIGLTIFFAVVGTWKD